MTTDPSVRDWSAFAVAGDCRMDEPWQLISWAMAAALVVPHTCADDDPCPTRFYMEGNQ